ncbi:nitrite reductase small subunit NirD [Corynebacterium uberis]|uniref:nitrite reductase small subunit NirD n=1 Tax=Corynebacterium TaxID=1716 RepID=UPI001D0AB2A1|nr:MULTISPECIES: nitrite reductase small subunit NirD [Corynebacterium]MCZ9309453.1 nitrite reductase small subunit NirD [Corynebacterium sp. c6VSa_13]UDL73002.1 nitrite reductase small subunit NirD [Corynebacterium uberis]UDL76121.1 nitrite reductase small subunit NirD [Corynebacterium uberis]UDL78333.1 nitrite reductase small subunit NirD [Corynebacterium uberis]UDL80616.1 nitrite reductase small subunit NirD [Corynebacterium uberis]
MSIDLCAASDLEPELGAAVLLNDGRQLALFRIPATAPHGGPDRLYAVDNIDPYSGAAVIARGIVGEHEGRPTVASPLLKQRFYLDDGTGLADDGKNLAVAAIEEHDGRVWLV